ncbi:MAG: alanine dehydrogenase [Flavobacteriales bacterium]|nr:alanine dehydrogenase [Flavobacteriales bacterium]|tara:strand:+ start:811 stop:2010 length:1200 start_codon:yes stop_codon:yes gene_type:complete
MKIGILREEKYPPDKRVVFTPNQCKWIIENTNIALFVQSSNIRCFSDELYKKEGVKIVEDLSECDILIGVKEVPHSLLVSSKMYFFFSHTIKKQPYNRSLLQKMVKLNIQMVDYELLKDSYNKRLLGFGRYAGIVGAYNGLLAYGIKSGQYNLKAAKLCDGREEVESELLKLRLKKEKILLTGNGRVARGALEILNLSKIKEVSKYDFLNKEFDEAVFCRIDTLDYNERIDGGNSEKYDFYTNPEQYKSSFMKYARVTDLFISGHFYSSGSPYLYTREDVRSNDFNIKVVADISCDIDGPVASTIRSSTIENPIYGYNPLTEIEDDYLKDGIVAVMAVDNLPCELPKDSSEDFGREFIDKILPSIIGEDNENIINKATICKNGDLTPQFEYLRDYLNGN